VGVLCIHSILSVFPSDLPGVNPATLNGMILYYRSMTKWSGLGDSTELSRMGLSQFRSKVERCNVQRFVLRKTIDMEQLWYRSSSPSIFITWCKNSN
jgi:hypothetical protein